jgi:hypothetical protein
MRNNPIELTDAELDDILRQTLAQAAGEATAG